ncbi:MAG: sigma-70 family RNA polymerase sigma factor [Planctomycetes bacterium]|nr:sigma-70 family RNA polymerase sigma factor [Planctomycetota bacterium]
MFDELKNLNIDTCSGSGLRALIRQALPIFLQACQKLLIEDKLNQSPCDSCDKYNTCEELCELLKAKLPSIHSGSYLLNKTFGNLMEEISDLSMGNSDNDDSKPPRLDHSSLKAINKIRSDEIFGFYKNCSFIFTPKEWRVVTLKVQQGKTYREIGGNLGIATSTASDTFQRAKRRMERHYQKKMKHVTTRQNP